MRQPAVAALARLVPRETCYLRQLLGMTGRASPVVGSAQDEVVRSVALLAGRPAVKLLLGSCNLMTARAFLGGVVVLGSRRVRIVAADTAARRAAKRVVGMNRRMAARTG